MGVIHLLKSIESEQTFDVIVRAVAEGVSDLPKATLQVDYSIGLSDSQLLQLTPGEVRVLFPIELYDDNVTEGTETARLALLQVEGSAADFQLSENGNVTLFVEDDEERESIMIVHAQQHRQPS